MRKNEEEKKRIDAKKTTLELETTTDDNYIYIYIRFASLAVQFDFRFIFSPSFLYVCVSTRKFLSSVLKTIFVNCLSKLERVVGQENRMFLSLVLRKICSSVSYHENRIRFSSLKGNSAEQANERPVREHVDVDFNSVQTVEIVIKLL